MHKGKKNPQNLFTGGQRWTEAEPTGQIYIYTQKQRSIADYLNQPCARCDIQHMNNP